MSGSPIGDVSNGTYFDIEFPGFGPNQMPYLSYGKHAFTISINPDPGGYGGNLSKESLQGSSPLGRTCQGGKPSRPGRVRPDYCEMAESSHRYRYRIRAPSHDLMDNDFSV